MLITREYSLRSKSKNSRYETCCECNRKKNHFDEHYQLCNPCYRAKTVIPCGNEAVDNLIRYSLINNDKREGRMEFVPYEKFEDVELFAEGGFSEIYKATWTDGPIFNWNEKKFIYGKKSKNGGITVALKELKNSENINSKGLNELKTYSNFASNWKDQQKLFNTCYGITQNPITQNFMIITNYYESGNLTQYITINAKINWHNNKLKILNDIASGIKKLHEADIIHKDCHSGNVLITGKSKGCIVSAVIADLGINKSAMDSDEIYGVIPYVAPEIFQGQKYTKASDIYSIGMIMWELMTGRKPFWDRNHDADLINEICDGLRPLILPIVTNAPKGYTELMQKCWHSDPKYRPTVFELLNEIGNIRDDEARQYQINNSSDIGTVTTNNPGAIYNSRPLSTMISLKSTSQISKRKYDNQTEDNKNKRKPIKKIKSDEKRR